MSVLATEANLVGNIDCDLGMQRFGNQRGQRKFTFVLAKSPWTNLLQAGYVHILVMTPEKAQPSEMFAFHELTSHFEQTNNVKSDFLIMRTYYACSSIVTAI